MYIYIYIYIYIFIYLFIHAFIFVGTCLLLGGGGLFTASFLGFQGLAVEGVLRASCALGGAQQGLVEVPGNEPEGFRV